MNGPLGGFFFFFPLSHVAPVSHNMQQMSLDALESESTLEEYLSHLDVSQGFVQLKVFTKRTQEARVKARRCYELLLSGCHVLSKKCADGIRPHAMRSRANFFFLVCAPDPFIVVPRGTSNKPTKHSAPTGGSSPTPPSNSLGCKKKKESLTAQGFAPSTVTLRVWSLLPASFVLGEPLLVSADGGAPLLSICEACADTCRRRRKAPVDERALLPIGGAVILKEAPKARGMLERLVEHHFQVRCGGGSRGCKNESSKGFRVALPILGPHCRHDREAERLLSPTLLPMKEDAHTRPLYPGTPAGEYYSMKLLGDAAKECFRNEIDSAKIRGQLEVFFSLLHTRITKCALGGLLAGPAFKVHAKSRPAYTLPELRFAVSRFKVGTACPLRQQKKGKPFFLSGSSLEKLRGRSQKNAHGSKSVELG